MDKFLSFSSSVSSINRDSGEILGVSLITEGAVLGHKCFADKNTNKTVLEACNKLGQVKVKCNHGSDVGSVVGILSNFRIDGSQVKADLQLLKSSDRYDYLLEMAEKLPKQFGLSIAFKPVFEKINKKDFVRCEEIYSADIVDAPAANPNGLFAKDMKKDKDAKKVDDEKVIDTDTEDTDAEKEQDKEDLSKKEVKKDEEVKAKDDESKEDPEEEKTETTEEEKEEDDEEMSNKDLVKLVKSLEAKFIAGMPTAAIQSSDVNTIACKNCQDTSHVLDSLNELHGTATVMIADHKKKIEDHNQKLNGFQDQLKAVTDSIAKFSEFEHQIKVVNDVVEALNNKLNAHQLELEADREEFSTKLENQKAEFETQLKDADLLACRKLAATGVPISKIPSAEVALSVVNPMEQFNAIVNPVEKAQFWKDHGAEIKKAFQVQANKINTQK